MCLTNTEWTHFESLFVPHKYRLNTFRVTIYASQIQNEHTLSHYLCLVNTEWTHFGSLFVPRKYRMNTFWVTICASQIQNEHILSHYLCLVNTEWTHFESLFIHIFFKMIDLRLESNHLLSSNCFLMSLITNQSCMRSVCDKSLLASYKTIC